MWTMQHLLSHNRNIGIIFLWPSQLSQNIENTQGQKYFLSKSDWFTRRQPWKALQFSRFFILSVFSVANINFRMFVRQLCMSFCQYSVSYTLSGRESCCPNDISLHRQLHSYWALTFAKTRLRQQSTKKLRLPL